MKNLTLFVSISAALASSLLHAKNPSPSAKTLDTVVVTATRSKLPLAQNLSASTVLERADIERAQAPDLIDLLARQAGVDVSRTGGPGSAATLFLRGSNSNHTLVLIDGVRVNSAQQGLYDFAHVPLDRIQRIEIVRGPRAALWGSDAIGGVIQIFTRDPSESGAQMRLGSFERREGAIQLGTETALGSFGLGGGIQDVGGYNVSTRSNFSFDPDRDGYRNRHLSLTGRTRVGSHMLSFNTLATNSDVEFDRGLTQAHTLLGGATLAGPLSDRWNQSLALGHAREDLLTVSSFGNRFESKRSTLDWVNDLQLGGGNALLFGLNHTDDQATSRNAVGVATYDRGRTNTGLFGAWRANTGAQSWDVSGRVDDSSQFGRTTSAQAAWGWDFAEAWQWRVSWGQGFRAPSTNELYSPGFGGSFAGNPALRPERSRSLESGLTWQGERAGAGLSVYRTRVADLIAFSGPRFAATNINLATLEGVELQGGWRLGLAEFQGHVGWQRAENARTGAALLRRAPRKAALSVGLPANAWLRFGLDATAVSRRQDFNGPLGGYARFDLRVEARFGQDWALRARVENLLDRPYTLASGFATPGRSLLLELAYRSTPATR